MQPILGLDLKINSVRRFAVGDSLMGPTCSLPVPFFKSKYFFLVNVVQLTTLLDIVVGGRLGVNFFPPTATSDFAGPLQTGLLLIEIGNQGWVGNFNLNLVCFAVWPVASDVPVGG